MLSDQVEHQQAETKEERKMKMKKQKLNLNKQEFLTFGRKILEFLCGF